MVGLLFAGAVSVARYREAVALAYARIAALDRSRTNSKNAVTDRGVTDSSVSGEKMTKWDIDSEFFQRGLELDPRGCGAGYARIAVAARASSPRDAAECANWALASNPEAWRPWYDAFMASPHR
jgi:hypothetical protein